MDSQHQPRVAWSQRRGPGHIRQVDVASAKGGDEGKRASTSWPRYPVHISWVCALALCKVHIDNLRTSSVLDSGRDFPVRDALGRAVAGPESKTRAASLAKAWTGERLGRIPARVFPSQTRRVARSRQAMRTWEYVHDKYMYTYSLASRHHPVPSYMYAGCCVGGPRFPPPLNLNRSIFSVLGGLHLHMATSPPTAPANVAFPWSLACTTPRCAVVLLTATMCPGANATR